MHIALEALHPTYDLENSTEPGSTRSVLNIDGALPVESVESVSVLPRAQNICKNIACNFPWGCLEHELRPTDHFNRTHKQPYLKYDA